MKIQQIRNATVKILFAGKIFLIDPMFAPMKFFPPLQNKRWPLVPLPMDPQDIIKDVDAIIITHCHIDHLDEFALNILPKNKIMFVQDEIDAAFLQKHGFYNLAILSEKGIYIDDIKLYKTKCRHGERSLAEPLYNALNMRYESMGIVFEHACEPTLYLAGDTVWCDFVQQSLDKFKPDAVILNAAGAWLPQCGFIIMNESDVLSLHEYMPQTRLIASHMDCVGHATVRRLSLREFAFEHNFTVDIPLDGESIQMEKV